MVARWGVCGGGIVPLVGFDALGSCGGALWSVSCVWLRVVVCAGSCTWVARWGVCGVGIV